VQHLQNRVSSPRTAVAGCGYWGVNLVRNFSGLGALAAVIDPRPGIAAEFSAKYRVAAQDWAQALDNPAIDAVAIAAPAEQHARMVTEALKAGKHVFVEKPLALRYAEGGRQCRG
jgi:UDP-2-acetamido-3-amino-2,3-dideoxy-glucuronate N-acetyltransferase